MKGVVNRIDLSDSAKQCIADWMTIIGTGATFVGCMITLGGTIMRDMNRECFLADSNEAMKGLNTIYTILMNNQGE